MNWLIGFFLVNVVVTIVHKLYLFYVKRKHKIVFKGRALTLVEATNEEATALLGGNMY